VGSSPIGLVTQLEEKARVTNEAQKGNDTQDGNLVEFLFSQPDFVEKLAEQWNELPLEIRAAIGKIVKQ
jgi:hypothetical protein